MDIDEWKSDLKAACPLCGFRRGKHYNDGYCPTPSGGMPSFDRDNKPLPGPNAPRGRFGVPIIYPDQEATYQPICPEGMSAPTPAESCQKGGETCEPFDFDIYNGFKKR